MTQPLGLHLPEGQQLIKHQLELRPLIKQPRELHLPMDLQLIKHQVVLQLPTKRQLMEQQLWKQPRKVHHLKQIQPPISSHHLHQQPGNDQNSRFVILTIFLRSFGKQIE